MKKQIITLSLLTAFLGSSSLYASEISFDTLGVNLGKSHFSYKQEDNNGAIILGNEPDKSFNSIELFTTVKGLCTNDSRKPYISYTYSKNDDLKHQYLLVGLNQYYSPASTKLSLYAGPLVGYGRLTWRYDPLNSSQNEKKNADSFLGGVQAGVSYPITRSFSLGLNGKYLFTGYKTELDPSSSVSSTIKHKQLSTVSLSLGYSF